MGTLHPRHSFTESHPTVYGSVRAVREKSPTNEMLADEESIVGKMKGLIVRPIV